MGQRPHGYYRGGTAGPDGSAITATALDAAGNTVVAGYFSGTFTLGTTTLTSAGRPDIFVAKLSPDGQWIQAMSAGGPGQDYANTLVLSGGSVVVAGLTPGLYLVRCGAATSRLQVE